MEAEGNPKKSGGEANYRGVSDLTIEAIVQLENVAPTTFSMERFHRLLVPRAFTQRVRNTCTQTCYANTSSRARDNFVGVSLCVLRSG